MSIEQTVAPQSTQQGFVELSKEDEADLAIMVTLTKNLIDDGGYEIIEQAQNSKDPGVVIGQFLMQLLTQLEEQLPFEPAPIVIFAEDGWVEQVSDYIQEEYKVPKKVMDRVEIYIATSATQMAQSAQQGQAPAEGQPAPQQGAGPQAGPAVPMPQGGT